MAGSRETLGVAERWGLAGLLFALALVVAIARWGFGYPWCTDGVDEHFWAYILGARAEGVFIPIYGPVFVHLLMWLTPLSGASWPDAIAMLGWLSVPVLAAFGFLFYRHALGRSLAWPVLAALSTTGYFWAPLIESKPQQWGQWSALLAGWMLCRALSGQLRWRWVALAATAVAALHILSFGILVLVSGWCWLILFLLQRVQMRQGLCAAACLLPGLALLLAPFGPYDVAIQVIVENHFVDWGSTLRMAFAVLLAVLVMAVLVTRSRVPITDWLVRRSAAGSSAVLRVTLFWALLIVCGASLAAQASLLPADYWSFYGYSPWRLLLAQGGNLLFLLLVLNGVVECLERIRFGIGADPLPHFLLLSVATGLSAVLALLITLQTTDSNWLLRVANYGVLFSAPLAALPLRRAFYARPRSTALLIAVTAPLSLLGSLRWSGLIDC